MRENLTHAIEDYLKCIYDICVTSERASTTQIAEALNITPASVTGMIKKLASTRPPLVDYQKHHGVALTPEGEKIALEIVRHHRLLEMFLHQILGYNWDEVHSEADRLEHVISEDFEERVAAALGHPRHDPHGDPIPGRDLSLPESPSMNLMQLLPGHRAVIHRVRDTDSALLRYLYGRGIVPHITIEVVDFNQLDNNLQIRILGQKEIIVLGPQITSQIYVEVVAFDQAYP
jgi:DtxR family transcriptional regulator, Mn-dependent transcriptional regulator